MNSFEKIMNSHKKIMNLFLADFKGQPKTVLMYALLCLVLGFCLCFANAEWMFDDALLRTLASQIKQKHSFWLIFNGTSATQSFPLYAALLAFLSAVIDPFLRTDIGQVSRSVAVFPGIICGFLLTQFVTNENKIRFQLFPVLAFACATAEPIGLISLLLVFSLHQSQKRIILKSFSMALACLLYGPDLLIIFLAAEVVLILSQLNVQLSRVSLKIELRKHWHKTLQFPVLVCLFLAVFFIFYFFVAPSAYFDGLWRDVWQRRVTSRWHEYGVHFQLWIFAVFIILFPLIQNTIINLNLVFYNFFNRFFKQIVKLNYSKENSPLCYRSSILPLAFTVFSVTHIWSLSNLSWLDVAPFMSGMIVLYRHNSRCTNLKKANRFAFQLLNSIRYASAFLLLCLPIAFLIPRKLWGLGYIYDAQFSSEILNPVLLSVGFVILGMVHLLRHSKFSQFPLEAVMVFCYLFIFAPVLHAALLRPVIILSQKIESKSTQLHAKSVDPSFLTLGLMHPGFWKNSEKLRQFPSGDPRAFEQNQPLLTPVWNEAECNTRGWKITARQNGVLLCEPGEAK